MTFMKVYEEVIEERHRQDKKWGVQNHAPYKWLAILGEEVGEANKAVLENDAQGSGLEGLKNYRAELVQVAAVAIETIECLDRQMVRARLLERKP